MDTKKYLGGKHDCNDILNKLTETFGAFRLLILSESGDIITNHNIDPAELERLKIELHSLSVIEVEISNRSKKYRVLIDRGSAEPSNKFADSEINHIMMPAVTLYIQKQERIFSDLASANRTERDTAEASKMGM